MKTACPAASLAFGFLLCATAFVQAQPPTQKPLTDLLKLKDGDIVFIESNSENAKAIKELTRSDLTHCGIVFKEGDGIDGLKVREGAGRGEYLSVKEWQKRESPDSSHPGAIFARRLRNRDEKLTPEILGLLKIAAQKLHETKYDKGFAWENSYGEGKDKKEYVYCSELVWKTFDRATPDSAKLHLGAPHRIDKYITDAKPADKKSVKATLEAKLNNEISRPYRKSPGHPDGENYKADELVISPQEVFESDLLEALTD